MLPDRTLQLPVKDADRALHWQLYWSVLVALYIDHGGCPSRHEARPVVPYDVSMNVGIANAGMQDLGAQVSSPGTKSNLFVRRGYARLRARILQEQALSLKKRQHPASIAWFG
jgi:hypothetical protein